MGDCLVRAALNFDQLSAVGLQELLSFVARPAGQAYHGLVIIDCSDTGKSDAGVSRCGLDDRHTVWQQTVLLRIMEHRPGWPILDRPRWVVPLELCEQPRARRSKVVEFDERSISRFHDVVTNQDVRAIPDLLGQISRLANLKATQLVRLSVTTARNSLVGRPPSAWQHCPFGSDALRYP